MSQRIGRVILAAALVALAVVTWRMVSVESDKRQISRSYDQAQQTLQEIEGEYDQLQRELADARGRAEEVDGLQQELLHVQERLNGAMSELTALQQEHEQLRQRNASLTTQVGSLAQEKQQLEVKLSSIAALRQAIQDVKQQMHDERWAAWRARVEAQKAEDARLLAEGNRGLVVRAGESTVGAATKLHVRVLEPQTP